MVPTLDQLEAAFRRYVATRRPEGPFAEFLPFASDQVTDWEAAASGDSAQADAAEVSSFPVLIRGKEHCIRSAMAVRAGSQVAARMWEQSGCRK